MMKIVYQLKIWRTEKRNKWKIEEARYSKRENEEITNKNKWKMKKLVIWRGDEWIAKKKRKKSEISSVNRPQHSRANLEFMNIY